MTPFNRFERRTNFAYSIKQTLINDYKIEEGYHLDKIVDCMLEEFNIYEHYEPKRKNLIRRILNVFIYPFVFASMPLKWVFTGESSYDVKKGFGKFLLWLLEGKQ